MRKNQAPSSRARSGAIVPNDGSELVIGINVTPLFVDEPKELVKDALVKDPSLDIPWNLLLGAFGQVVFRHSVVATLSGVTSALPVLIGELLGLGHIVVGRGKLPLDTDIGVCSLFRDA